MGNNHDNAAKIDALIAQTRDPVQQATLLVLAKIDSALDANTEATQQIADAFKKHQKEFNVHVVDEQKLLSGLKGAWWSGVLLITFIQVLGGYIISTHIRQNDQQDKDIRALREQHQLIVQALKQHGLDITVPVPSQ